MATFITSKAVGETVGLSVLTTSGFWKYNHNGVDSSVFVLAPSGFSDIMVENANGEFTIISCDENGNPYGILVGLGINDAQMTSFDGTGLTDLQALFFLQHSLTSLDLTDMSNLIQLYVVFTDPTINDQLLSQLSQSGKSGGLFMGGPRTLASNADYSNLVNTLGWTMMGLDLITTTQPTFITSKAVGETINIYPETSTGFWKYNHDGSDSSVFPNGGGEFTVTNANGEFTIISCDVDGIPSGDVTILNISNSQLTSFDGTGLSSLTELSLVGNQLTSFDGTGLTGLTHLYLGNNQLTSLDNFIFPTNLSGYLGLSSNLFTSFDGTGLGNLTGLSLSENQLTTFNGTGLSSLIYLGLDENQLTSFDGTGLINLEELECSYNQLTSFDGGDMGQITTLNLVNNQLTSFDGAGLSSLTELGLYNNQITSFDGTGLSSLTKLGLYNNQLTSFDGTGLSSLTELYLADNPLTSFNGGDMGQITYLDFDGSWNITTLESFDGTGLTGLTELSLVGNPLTSFVGGDMGQITTLDFNGWGITTLTSFDGGNMPQITNLTLTNNHLTSFTGSGLTGLNYLGLGNNQITSLDGFVFPNSLHVLVLPNNQLTSLDGFVFPNNLTILNVYNNQLTSLDVTGLSNLTELNLNYNQLTSLDVTGLTSLQYLYVGNNLLTPTVNNQILHQLNQHGLSGGEFSSSNGRTAASNTDYDNLLNNLGWYFEGLDLIAPPVVGNGKLRIKGITSGGGTPSSSNYTFNSALSTYFDTFTFNVEHSGPGKNDEYVSIVSATTTLKPSWYNTYEGGPFMTLYYASPSDIANNIHGHVAQTAYGASIDTTVSTNVYSSTNTPIYFNSDDPQGTPLNAPTPVSGLTFRVVLSTQADMGTVLEEFLITL